MDGYKNIYCPRCGRKIMKVRTESTIDMQANCKKCNKRISYFPETESVIVTNIPERTTSSGMRFY